MIFLASLINPLALELTRSGLAAAPLRRHYAVKPQLTQPSSVLQGPLNIRQEWCQKNRLPKPRFECIQAHPARARALIAERAFEAPPVPAAVWSKPAEAEHVRAAPVRFYFATD